MCVETKGGGVAVDKSSKKEKINMPVFPRIFLCADRNLLITLAAVEAAHALYMTRFYRHTSIRLLPPPHSLGRGPVVSRGWAGVSCNQRLTFSSV